MHEGLLFVHILKNGLEYIQYYGILYLFHQSTKEKISSLLLGVKISLVIWNISDSHFLL